MKKIFLFISFLFAISLSAQETYYWYEGAKEYLCPNGTQYFIYYEDNMLYCFLNDKSNAHVVRQGEYLSQDIKKSMPSNARWAIVDSSLFPEINKNYNIVYSTRNYKSTTCDCIGLSNLFYVKLKKSEDYQILTKIAKETNATVLGNDQYTPLLYILDCSKSNRFNALEAANYFYETNLFEYAEPDLMSDIKLSCPNDSLFSTQWNLKNIGQSGCISGYDINYCLANDRITGDTSIIVAVIDEGIDKTHPDLPNIHPLSFHCDANASPSGLVGNHGTKCAGVIGAATNNNIGVAGIAPNCQLMAISSFLTSSADGMRALAKGFNFAVNNGASVISNSWESKIKNTTLNTSIMNAIRNGRNGLGCVVVFAAANNNDTVSYPANLNDSILVVGAMSPCGERKNPNSCDGETGWGSNYGTELDVVAPGVGISTTNWQGGYVNNFNGTSSACPHVAGIAALMLSENPLLTQKDVCDIIESTARHIRTDIYNYSNVVGRNNGLWNNEVGYGLVDAYSAVQQACTGELVYQYHSIQADTTISACKIMVSNVDVSNNAKLSLKANQTITISGPFTVELGSELEAKTDY